MSEAITVWIHIVAVTVWLGPQVFMFVVTIPALRLIEDRATRVRVMRFVIYRFGYLGWGALAVIVLTGISNLFQEGADARIGLGDPDYRYFHIFTLKMVLVGAMVALTALHTLVIGPRQLKLAEEDRSESAEAKRLRGLSIAASGLVLLLSVATVYVAALLANHDYSFQPR